MNILWSPEAIEDLNSLRAYIATPFIVPYRVQRNVVQILRIYHGARRWPESL